MKKLLLGLCLSIMTVFAFGQGLEDIIVERYYVSDANDATDTDGGTLPEGSVTYRIFVDMLPGYNFQAVYGNANHTLQIATTTEFFNNEDRGEQTGEAIGDNRVDENTVALDSWISVGGATDAHLGVLKSEDPDGSIVGGANNDGGSEGIAGGLLVNADASAGLPLTTADGLVAGAPVDVTAVGDLDLSMFADANDGTALVTNGGSWAALGGVQGATASNTVLIAQITTDGELSFELNVQIGTPDGGVERYVASNPIDDEIQFPGLTFPSTAIAGCTDAAACNFNADATEDDGSCDVPEECEECVGEVAQLIDANNDGICDADQQGCTDNTACNFDADAAFDDGSCDVPEECEECVANAAQLIDENNDGICDLDQQGCTDNAACNFDADAAFDDGSCSVPGECEECVGGVAQLIDVNNDGICDNDQNGCTNADACNFDASAVNDDGSCIVPDPECETCENGAVVIVDVNNNGIADCEEDFNGLEDFICEVYYVSDANDATDTDGGNLPEGSTTYRFFVDMLPGYSFQAVYGNANHTLRLATSTEFFNNEDRGEQTGEAIGDNRVDENTVAVDSWISVGGATDAHLGVMKSEDPDGSIVGGANNDGGSEGIAGGLLANNDPMAGTPLTTADGLVAGAPVDVTAVGDLDLSMFADANDGTALETNGGSWAALGGVQGPTASNRVLIAQITVTAGGTLEYEFNIQIGTPDGGVERYVSSDAIDEEIQDDRLSGTKGEVIVEGCTNPEACNYNEEATQDDGTCSVPGVCEECVDSVATLIDENNDGICDLDQQGCTNDAACNFDADAAFDDGSCILPGVCEQCVGGVAVLIDENNDGICDLDQQGCTNADACNFDADAAFDDGSCILPGVCEVCEGGVAVLIDENNDGICDLDQQGCIDTTACNFDETAAFDDGSCILPGVCEVCEGGVAVLIDENNDGICDLDQQGCTDTTACNFDETAAFDDGSCILPGVCEVCEGGVAVLIDENNDGICDLDQLGCTNADACNFDADAAFDDGSCILPGVCEVCEGGVAVLIDENNDGICDLDQQGCTDASACNFDETAAFDDGSCSVPGECEECVGGVAQLIDVNNDGICDLDQNGCTNADACNFDASAVNDDGSCLVPDPECETCENGAVVIVDLNNNGIADCEEDFNGLEDFICEVYYVSDANDATDTDGGNLPEGSTTYRFFVDMLPGYSFQAVYGNANHTLRLATSTEFFNNEDRGEQTGEAIGDNRVDENTVAVDSWISVGGATDAHLGVMKSEDPDGSIVGGANNDGGSEGIAGGLLANNDPMAGLPLTTADGLVAGAPVDVTAVGDLDLSMFADANDGTALETNGGSWAALGGVQGPTASNRVLIAQITVTAGGTLEYEFNIQIGTPDGGVERYVSSDAIDEEIQDDRLSGTKGEVIVEGCTNPEACNYNEEATQDDGTCSVPGVCEECVDSVATLIDENNDGICDLDQQGCTNDAACNFDADAAFDDGSCILPGVCEQCVGGVAVLIDENNDGICDLDQQGCTDTTACNFDTDAAFDDGSCILPGVCEVCEGGVAVLIDENNDGICDLDQQGCTDTTACNFDADAAFDDGSCILPGVCEVCEGGVAVLIDENNDGICDLDQQGCTDTTACNFDTDAAFDDGSCILPGVCEVCEGGVAVLIDENNDGICDLDQQGCTDTTACNFDTDAAFDDGSCILPGVCEVCEGGVAVLIDENNDGICDLDQQGCTDTTACNFDADAAFDDGSCILPGVCEVCEGGVAVLIDENNDGICDLDQQGCTDTTACNFDTDAAFDDGSCILPGVCEVCEGGVAVLIDENNDGICDLDQQGCIDTTACNFDADAAFDDGSCILPGVCEVCEGGVAVLIDENNDGICDLDQQGCIDTTACNFDADAAFDDGSCILPGVCEVCEGGVAVLIDENNDGICDLDQQGCTDTTACNFDADAAFDDGSCILPGVCEVCEGGVAVLIDENNDGICDLDQQGCTDTTACNFDTDAAFDDGSCILPGVCEVCEGGVAVLIDENNDGICDLDQQGCTDTTACNFDADAAFDDGSCILPGVCEVCEGGVAVLIDENNDGICDLDQQGCTDTTACNFDADAAFDDGSCILPGVCEVCEGGVAVLIDENNDGICDLDQQGCTDTTACNFDADAAFDDGSCILPGVCEVCEGGVAVLIDENNDGICDLDQQGCTDDAACNFDVNAAFDDGSCVFVTDPECERCENGEVVIIDDNGNGIPDCEEPGDCSNSTLAVDAGDDQVVYPAYVYDDCDPLDASATGGVGSISYEWSTGETTASIYVCPAVSTTYTVTATDEAGCTATDDVFVCAKDIECGYGGVLVCWTYYYRGRIYAQYTYCVSPYVAFLLTNYYNTSRSTWTLGSCGGTDCNGGSAKTATGDFGSEDFLTDDEYALIYGETSLDIHPNPTAGQDVTIDIENIRTSNGEVEISVVDQLGKTVHAQVTELYNGTGSVELALDEDLPAGSYIVLIKTSSTVISEQLVVQ